MGLPRRGPRAGAETVRDRHARIPLLAARLGARAGKAALDEAPSLRPMGPGRGSSRGSGRGRGPQRVLRPARPALLPRRRSGERTRGALRRQRGHRDARAGARHPRRRAAGPLGRSSLRSRGVPRGLRRSGLDLRRPRGAADLRRRRRRDERRARTLESGVAPGGGARRRDPPPLRRRRHRAARPAGRGEHVQVRRSQDAPRQRSGERALRRAALVLQRAHRSVLGPARRPVPAERPRGSRRRPLLRGRRARLLCGGGRRNVAVRRRFLRALRAPDRARGGHGVRTRRRRSSPKRSSAAA